jgi:hypothetical protein
VPLTATSTNDLPVLFEIVLELLLLKVVYVVIVFIVPSGLISGGSYT